MNVHFGEFEESKKSEEISVTVLTYNSERTLFATLNALTSFSEVIVLDCQSIDQTRAIALSFDNVQLYETPVQGFGQLHKRANQLARHDWILSVDSDEVLCRDLVEEIHALCLEDRAKVYAFYRANFLWNKEICACGWSPDWVRRLFNKKRAGFDERLVHEKVVGVDLKTIYLKGRAHHTPYLTIDDFLEKMQRYSTLFAEQNRGKVKSGLAKALGHGFYSFFRTFIVRWGFLYGLSGWVISAYNGQTAYYKYLKLHELNLRDRSKG